MVFDETDPPRFGVRGSGDCSLDKVPDSLEERDKRLGLVGGRFGLVVDESIDEIDPRDVAFGRMGLDASNDDRDDRNPGKDGSWEKEPRGVDEMDDGSDVLGVRMNGLS